VSFFHKGTPTNRTSLCSTVKKTNAHFLRRGVD
jgi:hypothetical protein